MKIITRYQCEICNEEYENEQDAQECESLGISLSRFSEGNIIYILQRYPKNNNKPFVKRTLIKKFVKGHEEQWELDRPVQIGKDFTVGWTEEECLFLLGHEDYNGATDDIFCCSFGERYGIDEDQLTEDSIDLES